MQQLKWNFRLVDDSMNDVAAGERGEILLKGPVVSKGYYNNPKATADSVHDGWFCTGDIGIFRDEKLYIVDRKKVRNHPTCECKHVLTSNRNLLSTKDTKSRLQNSKHCFSLTL